MRHNGSVLSFVQRISVVRRSDRNQAKGLNRKEGKNLLHTCGMNGSASRSISEVGSDSEACTEETVDEPTDVDGSDDDDELVQVDFEFYDPIEQDFHGIKVLLQLYLDGEPFQVSELVDFVIQQKRVGTVLKTGSDGDPVGVVSVMNLQRHADVSFLKELRSHLKRRCQDQDTVHVLDGLFTRPGVALLISERLINCPPCLAVPLQDGIFDEISWATEDEPTAELRDSYVFQEYLILCRVYVPSDVAPGMDGGGSKRKRTVPETFIFLRPEDELFYEYSDWHFTYPCDRVERDDGMQQMRLVLTLKAAKIGDVRKRLHQLFGSS